MRNVILSILIGLVLWDIATTYYGTLSIFSDRGDGIIERIQASPGFVHIVSIVFAVALISFVLAYRIILNARNKITVGVLGVAFMYDFATSFYGTAEAAQLKQGNIPQLLIVLLLSIMCTAAPLLISHIFEQEDG